jgi:hypothetical protein
LAGTKQVAIISEAASAGVSLQVNLNIVFVGGSTGVIIFRHRRTGVFPISADEFTSRWSFLGAPIKRFNNWAALIEPTRQGLLFYEWIFPVKVFIFGLQCSAVSASDNNHWWGAQICLSCGSPACKFGSSIAGNFYVGFSVS